MPGKSVTIKDVTTPLTVKQKLFCIEFIKDGNATQAAIRAGYSAQTAQSQGSRLLSNVMVKDYVGRLMSGVEEEAIISSAYVLGSMKVVADRCMSEVEPMIDGSGNPIQCLTQDGTEVANVYNFNAAGALKALELLGKHKRLFVDRIEVANTSSAALDLMSGDLDAEEAAAKYQELFK